MKKIRTLLTVATVVTLGFSLSIFSGCQKGRAADVVVVGGGGAGLTAAITAAGQGADVILLEKMPMLGGNTVRAQTGINAAGTKYQEAAGIKDTPEIFYQDTMKGGHDKNNPDLVRVLTTNAKGALEWINSLGANLTRVQLMGGATKPRCHGVAEGGMAGPVMVQTLKKAAETKGVKILLETKATELIVDKSGKVIGVKAADKDGKTLQFKAKAVILATGGFGANPTMVQEYDPSLKGFATTNHPGATGEGIIMAQAVGAATVDMQYIQIHPTVVPVKGTLIPEGIRGAGAILVNSQGVRFVDELKPRDLVSQATLKQDGGAAFVLFDQAIMDESKLIVEEAQKNALIKGNTVNELAKNMGVPADGLKATIDKYNSCVASSEDPDFGRASLKKAIQHGPFYAVKVTPGIHHTMGGLAVNTQAQVLDKSGRPISGLYAAGEVTGGVHGANRLGGNALADIVVFGRIAGQNAAAFSKGK